MEQMESTDKTFSIEELANLSGVVRRTIRYYIELGLIDGPVGETRAAYYTWRHLQKLLDIRRLTEEGLSLERVRKRLLAPDTAAASDAAVLESPTIDVRTHLHLADGVDLVIEPGAARLTPEQLRRFAREARDALVRLRQETIK